MKSFKITIIFLALISLFLFAIMYFVYSNIKNINQKISLSQNELDLSNERRDYLLSEQKTISDLGPDIVRVNGSIIPNGEDVKFIEDLQALATQDGLSMDINSLSFEDDPKISSSSITYFKIVAETKGSWSGNYNFLAQIEALPFKVKISKFSLQSESDGWKSDFEIRLLKYKS